MNLAHHQSFYLLLMSDAGRVSLLQEANILSNVPQYCLNNLILERGGGERKVAGNHK